MKYISKLSPEQIKDVMEIYSPKHTDLKYELRERYISISLYDQEGIEETYDIEDYDVAIYDWMGKGDYLLRYRKKMLEWFGEQYAMDYLLDNC
ncbi:hypothetical protein ABE073_04305 [Lederbergia citrisecunda]|uniref:hypothetical protein n=1 Tax=Lederbergia citrisecunda TaxID=2833583 RepID=UPI003D2AD0AE